MTRATMCLLLFALCGCGATPRQHTVQGAKGVPGDLAIKLTMANVKQQRFALFKLDDDGSLAFAGGQRARFNAEPPQPVAILTAEQLEQTWALIQQYRLMDAKGDWLPKVQQVQWDVTLRANGKRRRIHVGDDKVPGIKPLFDLLFRYQAAVRYKIPGIADD